MRESGEDGLLEGGGRGEGERGEGGGSSPYEGLRAYTFYPQFPSDSALTWCSGVKLTGKRGGREIRRGTREAGQEEVTTGQEGAMTEREGEEKQGGRKRKNEDGRKRMRKRGWMGMRKGKER